MQEKRCIIDGPVTLPAMSFSRSSSPRAGRRGNMSDRAPSDRPRAVGASGRERERRAASCDGPLGRVDFPIEPRHFQSRVPLSTACLRSFANARNVASVSDFVSVQSGLGKSGRLDRRLNRGCSRRRRGRRRRLVSRRSPAPSDPRGLAASPRTRSRVVQFRNAPTLRVPLTPARHAVKMRAAMSAPRSPVRW